MPELPPLMRDQRKIDDDHLRLLSIFHFISAGLALLGIMFIIAHYYFLSSFIANPKIWADEKAGAAPVEFFNLFVWFYAVFGLWIAAGGIANLISGIGMLKRKWRTFSLVVAGLNSLHIPLGTILGVFTFIVLFRESVREMYEQSRLQV